MAKILRSIDKYLGMLIVSLLSLWRKKGKGPLKKEKILMIQLWALGDSVISLSLIRGIKEAFHNCTVDVLTRNRVKDVFECYPVDTIYSMDCLTDWRKLAGKHKAYDMVFDAELYFNISAILAFFLGKERTGFAHQFRSRLYTETVPFRYDRHMVHNYAEMLEVNGLKWQPLALERLRPGKEHHQNPRQFLSDNGDHKKLVGIAPGVGSSAKNRMWYEERYAELADKIIDELNCQIVLIDSKKNLQVAHKVMGYMKNKPVNAAGKFSLKEVFYLVSQCDIFVGNDSGLMHVAAAQGCKTIGLFGPNTPVLWGPIGINNVAIYKTKRKPAINNFKGTFKTGNRNQYMGPVTVEEVFKNVKRLIMDNTTVTPGL